MIPLHSILKVNCQGQVIAAIVAVNQFIAQKAARMVQVEYEDLEPIIMSIEVCKMKYDEVIFP